MVEDGEFIRFTGAFQEEGLMNLAHLFDHVRRHRPLDIQGAAAAAKGKEVRMVTTDFDTGRPLYLVPSVDDWLRIMWASATLAHGDPRQNQGARPVDVRRRNFGRPAATGGDRMGARSDILVIRTRPSGAHIAKGWMDTLATYWYRDNPAIVALYTDGHTRRTTATMSTGWHQEEKAAQQLGRNCPAWSPCRSDGYRINAGQPDAGLPPRDGAAPWTGSRAPAPAANRKWTIRTGLTYSVRSEVRNRV